MPSAEEINAAAKAMAEKANGGTFSDPLFYADQCREFWLGLVRTGLEAAEKVRLAEQEE